MSRPKSTTDSICIVCMKIFYRRLHGKKNKPKYCSYSCYWSINKKENHYHWKGGAPKCINCDKQLSDTKYTTKRCKECFYKYVVGENNPNWRGGKVNEYNKLKGSKEWKEWRLAVFRRDGFQCVLCGNNKSGKLNADHIKPRFLYPELTLDINNGRTLCIDCHKKTPTFGSKIYIYAKGI